MLSEPSGYITSMGRVTGTRMGESDDNGSPVADDEPVDIMLHNVALPALALIMREMPS
jgi:hypothetical protein